MNTLLQKSTLGFLFFCVNNANASVITHKAQPVPSTTKKIKATTNNNKKEITEEDMIKQVNVMIFLIESLLPKTTEGYKKVDFKQFQQDVKMKQKDFESLILVASPELAKVIKNEINISQAKTKESEFIHLKLVLKFLNFLLKLSNVKELKENDLANTEKRLFDILKKFDNINKKNISNEINSIINESKTFIKNSKTDSQYLVHLILFITYLETELTYLEVTNYIKNKK